MDRLTFACFVLSAIGPGPSPGSGPVTNPGASPGPSPSPNPSGPSPSPNPSPSPSPSPNPSAYYCPTATCDSGLPNIGCNPYPADGNPACGAERFAVTMTTAFKDKILQMHNAIRSKGALGLSGNSGLPKSSRSATVVWDDGLAVQASHMSRTCEIYSQVCSNTADLSNVGILTTQLGGPAAQNKDYNAAIDDAMDTWSMGYLAVGGDEIDSYPGYASDPAYMQLVRGNVYKIGCAIHYGKKGSGPALYTVCNYSSANVVGEPVYSKGPTASACKTGTNPNYPGLCSVNEIFK